jgi:hypothetical protein
MSGLPGILLSFFLYPRRPAFQSILARFFSGKVPIDLFERMDLETASDTVFPKSVANGCFTDFNPPFPDRTCFKGFLGLIQAIQVNIMIMQLSKVSQLSRKRAPCLTGLASR